MKQLLLTGGLGYLGGRLAKHLSASADIQLRITTHRQPEDIPSWAEAHEIVTVDLSASPLPDELCHGIDAVVHLAALNAGQCAADPEQAIAVNIGGTQKLVAAAAANDVRRFVYVSTAHVYGAPLLGNISEQTLPRPSHPYAWSHRAAEDIVLAEHKLDGVVLRLTNATGVPADPQADCWMLVGNDLCRQAAVHGTMTLRGNGAALRDFIPLGDACSSIQHFLQSARPAEETQVFNVGSSQAQSIFQLATMIADTAEELFGRRPNIVRQHPDDDSTPTPLEIGIDKLLQAGFQPTASLQQEIRDTLIFCDQHYS